MQMLMNKMNIKKRDILRIFLTCFSAGRHLYIVTRKSAPVASIPILCFFVNSDCEKRRVSALFSTETIFLHKDCYFFKKNFDCFFDKWLLVCYHIIKNILYPNSVNKSKFRL